MDIRKILKQLLWRTHNQETPLLDSEGSRRDPRYIIFSSALIEPLGAEEDDLFFASVPSVETKEKYYEKVSGGEKPPDDYIADSDLLILSTDSGLMKFVGYDQEAQTDAYYCDFEGTIEKKASSRYFPRLYETETRDVLPERLLWFPPVPCLYSFQRNEGMAADLIKAELALPSDYQERGFPEFDERSIVIYYPIQGEAHRVGGRSFSAPRLYGEGDRISFDFGKST